MNSESAKASPTSHTYFSKRLRLHYLDWGNPDAPPLLLIHGNRDHCHNWDWVARELCDEYHIIAPDFSGHGDSAWVFGSAYSNTEYIYDLAQLVHQQNLAPLHIIAHSLGGGVALRYAGIYPEHIKKMVVIEGMGGPSWGPGDKPIHERMRDWIEGNRTISGRVPKRYDTMEEAYKRMHEANSHLRDDQARYLTVHGTSQNEDGTYSWKFDNYTHVMAPCDMTSAQTEELWSRIDAPLLLISGTESWHTKDLTRDPAEFFSNARHEKLAEAGHWVHHDQLDKFLGLTREFFAEQ